MDRLAIETVEAWQRDPRRFAWDNFRVELEHWQADVGDAINASPKVRVGMQAAVGVGKSFELAVEAWRFLSTNGDPIRYPNRFPTGYCLSITADNLKSGLWKELGILYQMSPFLQSQFIYTAEQIVHRDHPLIWWLRARSFAKTAAPDAQGAALSGLHGPYLGVFLDEVGEMHPALGRRAEQILSDSVCVRGIVLAAGNPTSTTGLLYRIATGTGWKVVRITGDPDDPKRSTRVDLAWAKENIAKEGRNNAWVKAHILGEFPDGGINSLLGPDEVRAAMDRSLPPEAYDWAQKRLGIDVARFGDDRTVIFPRQGLCAFAPIEMRQRDTNFIAAKALTIINQWEAQLTFVDDTGHWGHGVFDNLLAAGAACIPVNYADKNVNNPRYFNKRTEMLFEAREWVKRGGALPNNPELLEEMCAVTYYFQDGKIRITDKDKIKETLGRSPDLFDALAQTWAIPDKPAGFSVQEGLASGRIVPGYGSGGVVGDYDPFDPRRHW